MPNTSSQEMRRKSLGWKTHMCSLSGLRPLNTKTLLYEKPSKTKPCLGEQQTTQIETATRCVDCYLAINARRGLCLSSSFKANSLCRGRHMWWNAYSRISNPTQNMRFMCAPCFATTQKTKSEALEPKKAQNNETNAGRSKYEANNVL